MKKYRSKGVSYMRIEAVEVERETESSVWINGGRYAKRGAYDNYFDTWGEAHAHLITQAENSVDLKRRQLQRANDVLGNIKGMKPASGEQLKGA